MRASGSGLRSRPCVVLLVAALTGVGAFQVSHAVECPSSLLREAVKDTDLIFAGTVLRIEWTREPAPQPARSSPHFADAVTFSVDKSWRGQPGDQIEIRSSRRVDCRREFAVGERYLVYADRRSEDGRAITTCCHRGGPIVPGVLSPEVAASLDAGQGMPDASALEMEELDRLVANIPGPSAADEDEIRALWDGYLDAAEGGKAEEAAARHCPEMFALFERWKDLALYAPQEEILRLHMQELMVVLGLRHRLGLELRDLSGRQLLEKSYRERWHGWVGVFTRPLAMVRVDRPEARGFPDTGDDILPVAVLFRRVDDRWCYDKAASIVNTFEQPDPMRIAIEQFGSSQRKSFLEMIQQSIPGDSGMPAQTDATIWQPLLPRP